ncbi:MAG: CRISPR system precrRNA processing endoribonuclease RAMP protein Cas6 [Caldilineaceae bacterium]|nr:CRISPR system precrRNA processing endoribonuclease RAMP protein Cas6 [Caldilineaceae bacterium]
MISPQPVPDTAQTPAIPLSVHQLRFSVQVTEPIYFNEFKGSALRGALAGTLGNTFCPQWRAEETNPLHQSLCPVCQLLSLERTDETSGDIRRPYAVRPPLDSATRYAVGQSFEFDMLLIGDNLHLLPYLVLAVQGVGETSGIGRRGENHRRGHFTITSIDAVNPLSGEMQPLLTSQGRMVRQPAIPILHEHVMATVETMLPELEEGGNRLTVHMRTPLRLIQGGERVQDPRFFPLGKQSVLRVLDLSAQHGGGRPAVQLKRDIYPWIDQVTLVEDRTRWWDLKGYSGRLQRSQVMGGLMGAATYIAPDWRPLLPWLIWGSIVGVGKNIVKGCGVVGVGR